jgi:hypothetical protein
MIIKISNKKLIIVVIISILFVLPSYAKHKHLEKYYRNIWCNKNNGIKEVVMQDGSRADCVTITNAVEFDYAYKWAESHGQAIRYARETGKRAGIVLIMENPAKEQKFYDELLKDIEYSDKNPIDVWIMKN